MKAAAFDLEPQRFEANRIVLYESVLHHPGARHVEQAVVRLLPRQC